MKKIVLYICTMIMASCSLIEVHQKESEVAAKSWAEAFFSFDLARANQLTVEESRPWLHFMASNITDEDLDFANSEDASTSAHIDDVTELPGDTMCLIKLVVDNAFVADSIGSRAHLVDEYHTTVTVVKRHGRWMVRMAGPPRNEMQNRD